MLDELILDTGALVSLLDASQEHHQACRDIFQKEDRPLVTSEAVITEATHLLSRVPHGLITCLEFVTASRIVVMPTTAEAMRRITVLVRKYHDVPMDYADATLVVIGEELGSKTIFTLDRRGFETYRLHGRTPFHILP